MRRPHRVLVSVLLGLATAGSLVGCSSENATKNLAPKPFCEAVAAYENTLVRTSTRNKTAAAKEQLPALETVLRLAPADIEADVQTMVDAYRRVAAGHEITAKESPRLGAVVERVERYGVDRCELLKQQTGGGVV